MRIEGMLQAGQVVRYAQDLWKVEYVNQSRAYILPLRKHKVVLADREFEGTGRGVSIAPNSIIEVVKDVEKARTQIELAEAERELRELQNEIKELNAMPLKDREKLAKAKGIVLEKPKVAEPVRKPKVQGGGWKIIGVPPTFRAGSLADKVMAFIKRHPGKTTKEIVAEVQIEGAVASCVSRFFQADLIERI